MRWLAGEHVYDGGLFEGLNAAVEAVDIPLDGAALAEAFLIIDRLTARFSEAVGEFDRPRLWQLDAATSMTAWLRDRAGMTSRRAGATTATARRLRSLPVTAEAWRTGDPAGGLVEAVTAAVNDATVGLLAEHEAELIPTLVGLSTTDTVRVVRIWKHHATADGTEPVEEKRAVHLSRGLDGTWALDGTLDPEGGAIAKTALRLAQTPEAEGEPARTPTQRRHDALVDVCRWFLDHQRDRLGGRHRPPLNVIVNLDDLDTGRGGQMVDGPDLDGTTISRPLCDSVLHRVVMAGRSAVLDYGTATRTFPVGLFNAIVTRDQHCRFPGCDRPPEWGEAHHVVWFSRGGSTSIDNAVLTCSRHHHLVRQLDRCPRRRSRRRRTRPGHHLGARQRPLPHARTGSDRQPRCRRPTRHLHGPRLLTESAARQVRAPTGDCAPIGPLRPFTRTADR